MASACEIPPWVLVSQSQTYKLMSYDMFSSRFRSIRNPLHGWTCIGSSKGWLLFTIESHVFVPENKNSPNKPNKNKLEPTNKNKHEPNKNKLAEFKLVLESTNHVLESTNKNKHKPNNKKKKKKKKKPIQEKLVIFKKFVLFNPVSDIKVELPRIEVVPHVKAVPTSFRLSSPPDSWSCLIAITFTSYQDRSRLLLCRPGDETWTVVFEDFFKDIMFQNGVLHALVRRGHSDNKPMTHIFRIGDYDYNLHFIKQIQLKF